jgi:hypothetical protein
MDEKPPNLSWRLNLGVIGVLLIFVVTSAIAGVIGNRTDSALVSLWEKIANNEPILIDWRWLVGFFAFAATMFGIIAV